MSLNIKDKIDIRFLALVAITTLVGLWQILQAADKTSALANLTTHLRQKIVSLKDFQLA